MSTPKQCERDEAWGNAMYRVFKRGFGLTVVVVTTGALAAIPAGSALSGGSASSGPPAEQPPAISSQPSDRQQTARPIERGDRLASPLLPAGYVLVDTVVSNTNPNLKSTDRQPDGEPSLALNGANPNEIVISSFNSRWLNGNAAIYRSTNGGSIWTKAYSIPPPTGVARTGCPCDQVVDFDRSNRLLGTFLNFASNRGDVYTGSTANAGNPASWLWRTVNGVAQKTDNPGVDDADQPWLRVTRDAFKSTQDDAFVAYDDFTSPFDLRVSVSRGANPPNMTTTRIIGYPGPCNCVNPGTRLGPDHRNGTMYVLYQYDTARNPNGSVHIRYALNRSTNSGSTWSLNGSSVGITVAEANSSQPTPKFGTVNALLGGVDAVGVDNTSGNVYVVYGYRDPSTGKNRLAIARLASNGSGGLTVVYRRFVTGQVQAALPSVAVASNGTVGVLYDTFDGFNASGSPVFSAHLAQSIDHGSTFSDVKLLAFASSAKNNGDSRQRVLGDYQSLRARGSTFYGSFTANGAQFGRPVSDMDAIFFKAPARAAASGAAATVGTLPTG
ncbi:MAG: hypothetical protein M3Q30_05380 [Actinomycetota bacterium]|nr:hypothetical protein [Actinomycetota bacterium]